MTEFELYALQVRDSLQEEFRSPEFQNKVDFLAGLRNLARFDRFGRH